MKAEEIYVKIMHTCSKRDFWSRVYKAIASGNYQLRVNTTGNGWQIVERDEIADETHDAIESNAFLNYSLWDDRVKKIESCNFDF